MEPLGESSRLPIGGVGECGEGSSCDQTDHTAASTLADVAYKQAVAVGTAESLAVAPPLSLPPSASRLVQSYCDRLTMIQILTFSR